mgnify:CR=1 FL=1
MNEGAVCWGDGEVVCSVFRRLGERSPCGDSFVGVSCLMSLPAFWPSSLKESLYGTKGGCGDWL